MRISKMDLSNETLKYKADFGRVKEMWKHYWAKEVLKRPLVLGSIQKNDIPPFYRYYDAVHDHEKYLENIDAVLENTEYLGELLPFFPPDLGPDQFAAFLGAELKFSEASKTTNWVEPVIDNWETALPLKLNSENPTWKNILALAGKMAEHAKGKYLVGVCDLHSNADTLSALRSPQNLCMDFYDCPELIEKAMQDVRRLYQPVYNALYEAGGLNHKTGSIGWIPFWAEGRFASIQCDFMCMISPEICRKYVIPALEEEAAFLDHCVLHFDGPGALPHLDDVLSIKKIDALQWVSGDGQAPMHEWTDVLLKVQKAGKGLQIYGVNLEIIKTLSRILSPEGVVYCVNVKSREEFCGITDWLEKNI